MTRLPSLTLHDIACVARVQRSSVSMWRLRPGVVPFPQPVAHVDGAEHFDRDAVVDYLRATGRGSNPDAALDAVAFAVPHDADAEDVVTLLTLQASTGVELGELSTDELHALAADVDPADEFLLTEVRALSVTDDLGGYLDDLVEASFGPADALARFDASRLRRGERGLTDELVAVLSTAAAAARDALGGEAVFFNPQVDPVVFGRLVDGFTGIVLAPGTQRAWRRRALVGETDVRSHAPAAVHVLSVVGLATHEALSRTDELLADLGPSDVGIVVGAASTLCDPLSGEAARLRTATLEEKALAAAVRLPRGLWKAAHRQSLGVWVLDGARHHEFLSVADLEGAKVQLDDLASDVAAALMEPAADAVTGHRAPRYARRVPTTTVLGRPAVVPRGTVAVRLGDGHSSSHLERIHVATLTTSRDVAGCDVAVAPSPGAVTSRRRSLGELAGDRLLLLRRGVRVDPAAADPAGTVVVQSADGSFDAVRLDPFDAARYDRATRTERGDVVFLERPRPEARVDVDGGALVATPSRILRLLPGAPIGPQTLAAVINRLAGTGTAWTTWTVPLLPEAESRALDAALAGVTAYAGELRRHLAAGDDLTTSLIEGVAAGAVTLDPTLTQKEAG